MNGWEKLAQRLTRELQHCGPRGLVRPGELAAMCCTDPRWFPALLQLALWAASDRDPAVQAQRVEDELTAEAQIASAAEAEQFAVVAASVRRLADRPTWAEIQRRCEQ